MRVEPWYQRACTAIRLEDVTLSSASGFKPGLLNAFVFCSQETSEQWIPLPMHAQFVVVYLQVPWRICFSKRVQPRQLLQTALSTACMLQPGIRAVAARKGLQSTQTPALSRVEIAFFPIKVLNWGLFRNWEWDKGKAHQRGDVSCGWTADGISD